jgi:glycosyltransferase involved in cell wall biosynthesis
MATGLPVIATRVGGIPELIRHGENGILVPPQDVSALSQAMVRLIQDNEWCRLLGSNARKKALSSFSLEEMTARIEKIYMSLF